MMLDFLVPGLALLLALVCGAALSHPLRPAIGCAFEEILREIRNH